MTPDDLRVPDIVGEITGWRAWRIIGGNEKLPLLGSVTHTEMLWHPAHWTLATCGGRTSCRRGDLDQIPGIPGERCTCGLYAAKDRAQLVHLGYGSDAGDTPVFIGEVGLAGKVIAGSQGWRAEKGRIRRLHVPFHHWRFVEPLGRLYRVPVVLDNTQETAPEWGQEGMS